MDNQLKHSELVKYRALVLAAIDYWDNKLGFNNLSASGFSWEDHFKNLKEKTEECFQKGQLTRLKQWFRDLSESYIEQMDFKYNEYLNDKTIYNVNVFSDYYERVEKIIAKGKITTDNQFYDIKNYVDALFSVQNIDGQKIDVLNTLLNDYEHRNVKRR
jgi:hypothetical protein